MIWKETLFPIRKFFFSKRYVAKKIPSPSKNIYNNKPEINMKGRCSLESWRKFCCCFSVLERDIYIKKGKTELIR